MSDLTITLRVAAPHEFAHAIEIDAATEQQYADAGVFFRVAEDHPFVLGERERWRRAAERRDMHFAVLAGAPVGFLALDAIDSHAYLEQLSVRPEHGRRGIGRALLEHACELSRVRGSAELWLTTYDHIPWNRPFYERAGFHCVAESEWGPQVRATISAQRGVLPFPERRIAMRRPLG